MRGIWLALGTALWLMACGGAGSPTSNPLAEAQRLANRAGARAVVADLDTSSLTSRHKATSAARRGALSGGSSSAGDVSPGPDAASQLFSFAELYYAQYFPSHPATQAGAGALTYRYYPQTGIYLIVYGDAGVFVIGGPFGDRVIYVGQVHDFLHVVGGSVRGLVTSGLVLANHGESLSQPANATTFAFATLAAAGMPFDITVQTQPVGAVCTIADGRGTVGLSDVTRPSVSCVLLPMVDSWGNVMPPSFDGTAGDSGGDGGGADAAGADGSAGDGAAIANAPVVLVDRNGRRVSGTTDASGAYHLRIDGFVPPIIASVRRADGTVWHAPSVSPVIVRGFVHININGLTDWLASKVASAAGQNSSAGLTPAMVAANLPTLASAKAQLTSDLSQHLQSAGLDPAKIDLVTLPYLPDHTGYDKVLDGVVVTNTPGSPTTLLLKYALGGTVTGLGNQAGLSLSNGAETLAVAAGASSFTFNTLIAQNSAYNVSVASQPAGLVCVVSNGAGTITTGPVGSVQVKCAPPQTTFTVSGTISGLTTGGLVLTAMGQITQPAALATNFAFPYAVNAGTAYNVQVQTQPAGQVCSVANGSGVITANVTNVLVTCSSGAHSLGGSVSGLASSGLVLSTAGVAPLAVPAFASSFVFATALPSFTVYNVQVQSQPSDQACSVVNGSGVMPDAPVNNVQVSCVDVAPYRLSGTVSGLSSSGLMLSYNSGTALVQVAANATTFNFGRILSGGSGYSVTVQTQPTGATCTIANGTGTATGPVSNVVVSCSAVVPPNTVTTLAGGGSFGATVGGYADGTGSLAKFKRPSSVRLDAAGTLYVADTDNNLIRKVSPTGVVTTLAGGGSPGGTASGSADGLGTAASFNGPAGVAVDASGVVYVADYNNHRIRKITPDGLVSTLAGSGIAGFADGIGTAAKFYWPASVAVDAAGNVYVGDYGNNRIRRITPSGAVSTWAGSGAGGHADGSAATASFNGPLGIAIDAGGNLFVADLWNHLIRRVSPGGVVTTVAGGGATGAVAGGHADGVGQAATFLQPEDVAVDVGGNVYVADWGNHLIRKITPAGVVTTLAGGGSPGGTASGHADGVGVLATFWAPAGIAVANGGLLYVGDSANNLIRRISP